MAAAPGQLATLRSVFWNPDRTSGLTCTVCTTPGLGAGYRVCFACHGQRQSGRELADIVAPITYAIEGTQIMRDLYNYKTGDGGYTETSARDRLFNGLYLSLSEHLECFGGIDVIATVPSSSGRSAPHPVDQMRRMFGQGFEHSVVQYVGPAGLDRQQRRVLSPDRFAIDALTVRGSRVLLLDDAWVSGAHMQSVAAALKMSGATFVASVPIGRVVSPTYGETRSYLQEHAPEPFNPSKCPVSGIVHST